MREAVGSYFLLERLGAGGMAEVFLAERRGPAGFAKTCVVKRILPHLCEDPELVRLFESEARVAAALDHPNVVHVYDFGVDRGRPYLAMERAGYGSLRDALERARARGLRLSPRAAAYLGAEAARGLAFAHQGGIVHRDVSPENLLLAPPAEVKVADFGVARLLGRAAATTGGKVRGKREYMAPEQARGEPVDARADVWALGLCVWEALADAPPARAVRAGRPAPLAAVRDDVPRALDEALARALQEDPAARLGSAVELEAALRAVAGASGEGELAEFLRAAHPAAPRRTAAQPAPGERAPRTFWRNRAAAAGAFAGLAVLAGALALSRVRGARGREPLPAAAAAPTRAPTPGPVPAPVPRAAPASAPAARREPPRAVPPRVPPAPAPAAAPAPAPAPAAPSGSVGWLGVQVRPWAEVWIDGVRTRDTPLVRYALQPGPHRVRLIAPGGKTRELEVRIVAGREHILIEDATTWPLPP